MPLTPEEKILRRRERQRRYDASPKGQQTSREYRSARRKEHNAKKRAEYQAKKQSGPVWTAEQLVKRRAAMKRWWAKNRDTYNTKKQAERRALNEGTAQRPKPSQCEVCGNDKRRILFDHCHQRGVFRGWLCTHCNIILGHVNDDPNHLRKLIAYLERTKDLVPKQMSLTGI
jgi:hypothetical protein